MLPTIQVHVYGEFCEFEILCLGAPHIEIEIDDGVAKVSALGQGLRVIGKHDRLTARIDAEHLDDRRALAVALRECADQLHSSAAEREAKLEREAKIRNAP